MTREVLGAGRDAGLLEARDPGSRVGGDPLRCRPKRPHPDDGIDGIAVDVGVRGQVEVDTGSGELRAHRPRDRAGELDVVYGSEREVPRVRAACGSLQARDVAALLVDRDDESWILGVQARRERRQLSRRFDVARIEAHATQPGGGAPQDPVGWIRADEAGQQAAVGHAFDGAHDQPLTAPAVSPPAMRRWTSRKNTTTGMLVKVAPAMSPPQSVPCCVVKDASQMVSVCFDEELNKT